MNAPIPKMTKGKNEKGVTQYYFWADSSWDGFDTLVKYLQITWNAQVTESEDKIYSRRWVLRSSGVPISLYHDSQMGNSFLREDGIVDQSLLEKIYLDLMQRLA